MEFGSGRFHLTNSSYPWQSALVADHSPRLVHIGLPVWSDNHWKGMLYTENCAQKNFLQQYAQRLDCVEVSSTFYADISEKILKNWKATVGKNFRFLPKWPRVLTHDKGLHHISEEALHFVRKMQVLEQNLGTTMLQLPPSFTTTQTRDLFEFLRILPKDFPICIEFRHRSWFQQGRLYPKLEEYLVKEKIGSVITDSAGQRDVFHLSFTGPNTIVPEMIPWIAPEVQERIDNLNGPVQQTMAI